MRGFKPWIVAAAGMVLPGCGASPGDVCEHIQGIVAAEVGEDAAVEAIDGCRPTWELRRSTKSRLAYKELADCVMNSDDFASLARCE